MRIIFLGTPAFSVNSLDALVKSKHTVVAVVTQPDKPTERGNKIEFSAVKKYALANDIPLFQFPKISRDGVVDLKALEPDVMITAAYGQILSQEVLDIPRLGTINVHASLLPKYRGASPIQTAIINGDAETGVTIMKTEIGLDTGDIIDYVSTPIFEEETAGELSERLADLGSKLLLDVLDKLEQGTANLTQQEHINATVTSKISKIMSQWSIKLLDINGPDWAIYTYEMDLKYLIHFNVDFYDLEIRIKLEDLKLNVIHHIESLRDETTYRDNLINIVFFE